MAQTSPQQLPNTQSNQHNQLQGQQQIIKESQIKAQNFSLTHPEKQQIKQQNQPEKVQQSENIVQKIPAPQPQKQQSQLRNQPQIIQESETKKENISQSQAQKQQTQQKQHHQSSPEKPKSKSKSKKGQQMQKQEQLQPKSQSQPQPQPQVGQNPSFTLTDNTEKLLEQSKQKMMPLIRYLKKNGLKFKTAGCNGVRVQYFRTDMLADLLQKKQKQIESDPKLLSLVRQLNTELIYYKRPQNSQKLRFPQFLNRTQVGKFAGFRFDTNQPKRIYFIVVLLIILAGVLFPLWPYQLKYALWLLSVAVLVLMVSIILLRLVLYTIMASFGISFWLFPNLFGDYGVLDSLRPVFSVSKWQNDIFSIILRVLSFSLFIYYCHSIYTQPEFYKQNFESAKDIVKDVHDWGVGKISGQAGNFSQRALTMQKILNQTADAFQESKDHYTTFEVPVPDTDFEEQQKKAEERIQDNQDNQNVEDLDEQQGQELQLNSKKVQVEAEDQRENTEPEPEPEPEAQAQEVL